MVYDPRSKPFKGCLPAGYYDPNWSKEEKLGFTPINPPPQPPKALPAAFPQYRPTLSQSQPLNGPIPKANSEGYRIRDLVRGLGYAEGAAARKAGEVASLSPKPPTNRATPAPVAAYYTKKPHPLASVISADADATAATTSMAKAIANSSVSATMKRKYAKFDPTVFEASNKRIKVMGDKFLPVSPHILTVDKGAMTPNWRNPYENLGTPFGSKELTKGCQYMTLLSDPANRGVSMAHGGWDDDEQAVNNAGGRSRSGTATPSDGEGRKKTKLSIKEWQAARASGTVSESFKQKRLELERQEAKEKTLADQAPPLVPAAAVTISGKGSDSKKDHQTASSAKVPSGGESRGEPASREVVPAGEAATPARNKRAELEGGSGFDSLPPLLSPLPANFTSPDDDNEPSLLALPPLLSPTLPPAVEKVLDKIKSSSSSGRSSVEARYENSRQVGAPGVAMKKPKQRLKGGKSLPSEHGRIETFEMDESDDEPAAKKDELVIKLKYNRRNAKNIKRILALPPRSHSSKTSSSLEKPSPAPPKSDKKRSNPEDDQAEHSAKRQKATADLQGSKPNNAIAAASKPSGLPTTRPSQKSTAAPVRKDGIKSTSMNRVSSNDGHTRTPLGASVLTPKSALTSTPKAAPTSTPKAAPASTSTPNSVEKPRATNGHKTSDVETFKTSHVKNSHLGTVLKRRMDAILKSKEANPGPVSEADTKLGAIVGIESISAYMAGFHAIDMANTTERKRPQSVNWEQLLYLLPFVTRAAKTNPELHLLAVLATAISAEQLSVCYNDRLANDTATNTSDYARFKEAMINNNRARPAAWREYYDLEQSYAPSSFASKALRQRIHPGVPIPDVLATFSRVLADVNTKLGLKWDKKIDF